MKLRNKRTGEIVEFGYLQTDYVAPLVLTYHKDGKPTMAKYNSLAKLNEEWEDYEEPKECWYIDWNGEVQHFKNWHFSFDEDIEQCKQIGNYFETGEEAEKAVEKLKAWKRLKDKGFKFEGWDNTDRSTIHNFSLFVTIEDLDNINKDLDLLFGGEE